MRLPKDLALLLLSIVLASSPATTKAKEPRLMVIAAETVVPDTAGAAISEEDNDTNHGEGGEDNWKFQRRLGKQYDSNDLERLSPQDLVSDIHCLRTANIETFTAFLRLPPGIRARPVLEVNPAGDRELTCLITETNVQGIYALDLSRLSDCGVRECEEQDEQWLCLLIRFPVMNGLKLPEDEVIDIKCKPQDRQIRGRNEINFQKNSVEHRSPTIYLGGGQDFLSEIGLFRKLGGTDLYASRVRSGSTIELGEDVQLRSIVRSGDGWNFAKISDVVVHRVHEGRTMYDEHSTARLVTSDGCRNPSYRVLAPSNPWQDATNRLINNFDFRVFMFQAMESGDAIIITANVVACVEELDCAPVRCGEDSDHGYGRKRRSLSSHTAIANRTRKWEENLELKIRLPQDLLLREDGKVDNATPVSKPSPLTESECKLYLIATLSVALTFCVLSATVVLVACAKRCQDVRRRERERRKQEEQGREEEIRNQEASKKKQDQQQPQQLTNVTSTYLSSSHLVHLPPHYARSLELALQQQQQQLNSGSLQQQTSQNKPVTVRSVKRRDKAKMEQRLHHQTLAPASPYVIPRGVLENGNNRKMEEEDDDEERAVMV